MQSPVKHVVHTIASRQGDLNKMKAMVIGPLAPSLGRDLTRPRPSICNHNDNLHVGRVLFPLTTRRQAFVCASIDPSSRFVWEAFGPNTGLALDIPQSCRHLLRLQQATLEGVRKNHDWQCHT